LATRVTALVFFRKKKQMDNGRSSALFPIAAQGVEYRLRKEKPHKSRVQAHFFPLPRQHSHLQGSSCDVETATLRKAIQA